MTDTQAMKDTYSGLMDAVASGDVGAFGHSLTDDYVWHGNAGEEKDKAGIIEMVQGYVTAFPGMEFTVQSMMAEGDMLAAVWSVRGTHSGPLGDVPPTGREIDIRGHVLLRFEGDKVAEEWELFDEALMMQQLGLSEA